jgi:hypothetical protein
MDTKLETARQRETNVGKIEAPATDGSRQDAVILLGIAAAVALVHVLSNNRYGFHRDELQFLSDARHLGWGFVAYPPLTPFLERIGLAIFGVSLVGLRLFSVMAQAVAIVVTGLMARDLGGKRLAQGSAALVVALSPLPLFEGTEFQYSSFDYLWWVVAAWFIIRLLKCDNPRWWLAIGATLGIGLLTKYSIVFFIAGILAGLLFTRARRYYGSPWFWGGVALALLIFLPNLFWQFRHNFISYDFLEHIHKRDVGEGRANGFIRDQFKICVNVVATPLWLWGLWKFLRNRRYRMLGWMYLVPLALFMLGKGRGYYLAPAYPMLIAMGAAETEGWMMRLRALWRRAIEVVFFTLLTAVGIYVCAILLPLSQGGRLMRFALSINGDLREEIGWDELDRTVAGILNSLPPEQRRNTGIIVGNYGEAGAIEILGPRYGLPAPISMTNSAWLRGYPAPAPSTLIVIGFSREAAEEAFTSCRLTGHNGNGLDIHNEESDYHPDIFLCGGPHLPWPEFWKQYQAFG